MADRNLTVFLQQLGDYAFKYRGEAVEKGERRAQSDAQLLTDPPHGDSVPVMQEDRLNQELIADQAFGQHPRRLRLDELATARAVFPLQSVDDPLRTQGWGVQDRTGAESPRLQRARTVRTGVFHRDGFTVVRLRSFDAGASVAQNAPAERRRLCPLPLQRCWP